MKEGEGVICKSKKEALELATIAKNKGYKVCSLMFKKMKYKNIIFYDNEFCSAADYAIKFPITKKEFLEKC
jgi:hypothetical protein